MTPQDKFVTVYGQRIHYLEAGSGAVVILLHALGTDTSDWSKVIEPLSKHHRVIAFGQIGAGQSDKPFIQYRPGTWVDFIAGLYQALHIDRASLVGHSMHSSLVPIASAVDAAVCNSKAGCPES